MVVAHSFIRQTGFVQDSIDPSPSSHWKCAAEIADATGTYCSSESAQQPGPMLLVVPIAFRLVRVPGWWSCRRHIRLVNPIASVRHARSDFVRRANAVRPITYQAALDSMLIMGSPRHHPIVITERAAVCLTWPSASVISYFTMSRVCRRYSKERPKVPASLRHPEVLLSFSPIRAGRKGWMAPFGTLFPWPQPHAGLGADRYFHGNTNRKQETAPLASPTTSVIPSAPTLASRD